MDSLTLTFPAPASKKNRRATRRRRNGTAYSVPSAQAKLDEEAIRLQTQAEIRRLGHKLPLWPDEDVALEVDYLAREDKIKVTVRRLGPRPKGFTGRRRDLHGMLETIADALQRAAYRDDNQVARTVMDRVLEG